ncbi:2-amino-4-hydroxy-6-hydroxymethyldihydropteridine diphosphokinase, partial [Candidatus Omnitrophota bacterium]
MKHTAYLAVGSNKGDSKEIIAWAKVFLLIEPGISFDKEANIIETMPLGGPRQRNYLNTVWKIRTSLTAHSLMSY